MSMRFTENMLPGDRVIVFFHKVILRWMPRTSVCCYCVSQ